MDDRDKILGIDLGTTNTLFSVYRAGEPEMIENHEGNLITPSIVTQRSGEVIVGEPAKNQTIENPENTVESIKRHMGEKNYTVTLEQDEYTPEEISAFILQKVREDAREYLGYNISRAVITVPAYFSDRQRQATKNAGEIAGFTVERIINEPTAAAMAYGLNNTDNEDVLVTDLGGGTFDVTVMKIRDNTYDVKSTSGDTQLGGDDWTQILVDHLVRETEKTYGIDISTDLKAMQRVYDAAERAKKELSSKKSSVVNLPFIATLPEEGTIDLNKEITRTEFNQMAQGLVDRLDKPIDNAINETEFDTVADLDRIVMVGGATRMPMVQEVFKSRIDQTTDIARGVSSDAAVALGAAVQGAVVTDDIEDTVLFDVAPLSLGIEAKRGKFERIIDQNTTVPVSESRVFTTGEDNQTEVKIRLYQGEREIAEENELLDEFTLSGIPPAPAGTPRINVSIEIDENGMVRLSAREIDTNISNQITIESALGMSEEQIKRLRKDAEANEQEDEHKRERIETHNKAEKRLTQAAQLMDKYGTDLSDKLLDRLNDERNELRHQLEQSEEHKISIEDLNMILEDFEDTLEQVGLELYDDTENVQLSP